MMELSVEDGIIVLTYDSSNKLHDEREYFKDTAGMWEPIRKGKLKLRYTPNPAVNELDRAKEEENILSKIIPRYGNLGVIVDKTFLIKQEAVREALKPARERQRAEREAELAKQRQRDKWAWLCKHGCGNCKYNRMDGDDFRCAASGDLLEDENRPGYVNGVHYLFNYVPLPSDNCPFKVN